MRNSNPAKGVRRPGKGKRYPDASVRIVTSFDEETFAEVRALAVRERTSFVEQVRQLVEEALLERKEATKREAA